jgi:hypothetical protein
LLDKGAVLVPDGNSWSPITMEPFAPSESSTGGRTRTGPEATGARARSDLLEWELASSLALRRVHCASIVREGAMGRSRTRTDANQKCRRRSRIRVGAGVDHAQHVVVAVADERM